MTESSFSSYSLLCVDFEHLFEEIHNDSVCVFVLLGFKGKIACPVFLQDLAVTFPFEQTFSKEEKVEDEAETEDVADWTVSGLHVFDVDDFWGDVAGSAAPNEEVLF